MGMIIRKHNHYPAKDVKNYYTMIFNESLSYPRPMLTILQISALTDNYIYLLHDPESKETAVIDPPVAKPVLNLLNEQNWSLKYILNTHHHWDHIGGNDELKRANRCQIAASRYDQTRIPEVDIALDEGDVIQLGDQQLNVFETPGHTLGHIVFYAKESQALFCGDTLFGMGCGRLFEGSAEQMWHSLLRIKLLPAETHIYCAHEYTENNGRFALTLEPQNSRLHQRMSQIRQQRVAGLSTIPSTLADELATNPFLRTDCTELQTQLGLQNASEIEVFAKIRQLKDKF